MSGSAFFSDYVGRLGNKPPGARARVALTGPTVAEYFRDAEEAETKAAATTAVASNAKSRAAFESQSSDRIDKSDVAEETMSAVVKLAKDPLDPCDTAQPTAELQLMTPTNRRLVTQRDELRPVQSRAEDTDECVMTSHTEGCQVTSVEEGHDTEFENCAKESQEAKVEELQNTKASLSASLTKSKEDLAPSVTSAAETAKAISSLHQKM